MMTTNETDEIPSEAFALKKTHKLFALYIPEILKNSIYEQDIGENVFQPSNIKNQKIVFEIVKHLVKPQSYVSGEEHLEELAALSREGKSCLLLPEHYSNFDYPAFFYLIQENEILREAFQNLICMAASKLNTENKVVLAFSEAYNRIMIYPARAKKQNPTKKEKEEEKQLDQLNQRALKEMIQRKQQGHIILIFPSGTRYRSENPKSRHALQQVMGFIRNFDYFCFVGIAGNTLMVNPSNIMSEDVARRDILVYLIDKVRNAKEFLAQVSGKYANRTDYKTAVADEVTHQLQELHKKATELRAPLVENDPPEYMGPWSFSSP